LIEGKKITSCKCVFNRVLFNFSDKKKGISILRFEPSPFGEGRVRLQEKRNFLKCPLQKPL
jgi:hypothetical protein